MWIDRKDKKANFINILSTLSKQVLLVRGARQVGKTTFVLNCLKSMVPFNIIKANFLYASSMKIDGELFYGRDLFGNSGAEGFLQNIHMLMPQTSGNLPQNALPILVFIDEADQHPTILESIQQLAEQSSRFRFVLTGSNIDNVPVKNAATGRKRYFDLSPFSFEEFLQAWEEKNPGENLYQQFCQISPQSPPSEFCHQRLSQLAQIYLRLGGIPKVLDQYLDPKIGSAEIPELIKDLAFSIEENVKAVLGEKSKLYEYEDILRKIAHFSTDTLKFSKLQVQHAGKREANLLVHKTCAARVIHKIRLFQEGNDLSKYVLFDHGFAHYLLNGSDLLRSAISGQNLGILFETWMGNEIIRSLPSRDDIWFWKSGNQAELEFTLRSPCLIGIDVKAKARHSRSLDSFALNQEGAALLVLFDDHPPSFNSQYRAKLPSAETGRLIPLLKLPHYLAGRLTKIVDQL